MLELKDDGGKIVVVGDGFPDRLENNITINKIDPYYRIDLNVKSYGINKADCWNNRNVAFMELIATLQAQVPMPIYLAKFELEDTKVSLITNADQSEFLVTVVTKSTCECTFSNQFKELRLARLSFDSWVLHTLDKTSDLFITSYEG